LLALNFLRAFLDTEVPERLFEHIYMVEVGLLKKTFCFGPTFSTLEIWRPVGIPFYFPFGRKLQENTPSFWT